MRSSSEQVGLTLTFELDQTRNQYVVDRLREYNDAHRPAVSPDAPPAHVADIIEIYLVDRKQKVVGGLIGRTHSIPEWLEVTVIWVDDAWRRRGLGRELMTQAEQEAKRRGCRYARLATGDYQAPGFYPKLGYMLYGKLENCPFGVTVFYFRKDL